MKVLGVVAGAIAAATMAWLAVHRARPQAPAPVVEEPAVAAVPSSGPPPDAVTAAAAPVSPPGELEPIGACTVAVKGNSPVAVACRQGGRRAAKKIMKELVSAAQKNGARKACDQCHVDLDSYALLADAQLNFESLIQAARR
jgi:hypothetical protein